MLPPAAQRPRSPCGSTRKSPSVIAGKPTSLSDPISLKFRVLRAHDSPTTYQRGAPLGRLTGVMFSRCTKKRDRHPVELEYVYRDELAYIYRDFS